MDIQKEREAFEKWANENIAKGRMMNWQEWCWEAWQAAKAQAVPEGFVLAPKRSTDWQRVNARDMGPDIEDYENMSKLDWEKLCGEIYDRMVEVGPE